MSGPGVLARLQQWYSAQCDGEWEHDHGIEIETLDNPGWSVSVDLTGTSANLAPGRSAEVERDDDDWFHAVVRTVEGRVVFTAAGGPHNLEEILELFLSWSS